MDRERKRGKPPMFEEITILYRPIGDNKPSCLGSGRTQGDAHTPFLSPNFNIHYARSYNTSGIPLHTPSRCHTPDRDYPLPSIRSS
jgi:hypothetical protein